MLFVFMSVALQKVFVSLFLPFVLFQGIWRQHGKWMRLWDSVRRGRRFRPRQCTVLCASNYQCVGVLSKKLGLWFLLFFSVYCGLGFKWDANVIYSTWYDAVREDWTLQSRPAQGRAACEQCVLVGDEGAVQHGSCGHWGVNNMWRWLPFLWSVAESRSNAISHKCLRSC